MYESGSREKISWNIFKKKELKACWRGKNGSCVLFCFTSCLFFLFFFRAEGQSFHQLLNHMPIQRVECLCCSSCVSLLCFSSKCQSSKLHRAVESRRARSTVAHSSPKILQDEVHDMRLGCFGFLFFVFVDICLLFVTVQLCNPKKKQLQKTHLDRGRAASRHFNNPEAGVNMTSLSAPRDEQRHSLPSKQISN